jgi:cbb3-type cytochrome oxidase subunit 1
MEKFVQSSYQEYSKYRQRVVGAALFCHAVVFITFISYRTIDRSEKTADVIQIMNPFIYWSPLAYHRNDTGLIS